MAQLFSRQLIRKWIYISKITLLINSFSIIENCFATLIPEIDVRNFEVNVGIDLNVDINIDVNAEFYGFSQNRNIDSSIIHNLGLISQIGNYNEANLMQIGYMNYGIIYQEGSYNIAYQYQNGERNQALIYQKGAENYAKQEQIGVNNLAIIMQVGIGNYAEQYQRSNNGVRSIIIQEGNFNFARIYQY